MSKLRNLLLLVALAAPINIAVAAEAMEVIAADAVPADAIHVDIAKMKYAPAKIEVEEGQTVLWTNKDAMPHNVQIANPFKIAGNMLRAGQTFAIKFNEAGEYAYTCTPHPFMKGSITVKPKG